MITAQTRSCCFGDNELNRKLSEQRTAATCDYLIRQGLAESNIIALGFGKTMPVADNSTANGRQETGARR